MRPRITSTLFSEDELKLIHQVILEKSQDQQLETEKRNHLQEVIYKIEILMGLRPSQRYRSDGLCRT